MHILSKALGGKFIRLGKPKKLAGGQILILPTVLESTNGDSFIHFGIYFCIYYKKYSS